MWPNSFVNNLSNNFNVYSLDLREGGKSGIGEKFYTLEDMVDDVSYFMKIVFWKKTVKFCRKV